MAFVVLFDVPTMSMGQYDQVMRDLEAAGVGTPAGRLGHLCSARGEGAQVVDVWESPESLQAFAGVLMPILAQNGVTPPNPEVLPLHNAVPSR